jgi:hypothetical protein
MLGLSTRFVWLLQAGGDFSRDSHYGINTDPRHDAAKNRQRDAQPNHRQPALNL